MHPDELELEDISIRKIAEKILNLRTEKGKSYGLSWRKYGWLSAFFNMSRKWDRWEVQFRNQVMNNLNSDGLIREENLKEISEGENIRDSLVDLCAYSLMAIHLYDEQMTSRKK